MQLLSQGYLRFCVGPVNRLHVPGTPRSASGRRLHDQLWVDLMKSMRSNKRPVAAACFISSDNGSSTSTGLQVYMDESIDTWLIQNLVESLDAHLVGDNEVAQIHDLLLNRCSLVLGAFVGRIANTIVPESPRRVAWSSTNRRPVPVAVR